MATGRSGHTATLVEAAAADGGGATRGSRPLLVVFGGVVDRTELQDDLWVRPRTRIYHRKVRWWRCHNASLLP